MFFFNHEQVDTILKSKPGNLLRFTLYLMFISTSEVQSITFEITTTYVWLLFFCHCKFMQMLYHLHITRVLAVLYYTTER